MEFGQRASHCSSWIRVRRRRTEMQQTVLKMWVAPTSAQTLPSLGALGASSIKTSRSFPGSIPLPTSPPTLQDNLQ
ncbi:hypothetical protein NQZ68_030068 [Dissostichus eleginoides]|nr:hypothetical protein NQZ68_030068 [Dissostichus eleginoides]